MGTGRVQWSRAGVRGSKHTLNSKQQLPGLGFAGLTECETPPIHLPMDAPSELGLPNPIQLDNPIPMELCGPWRKEEMNSVSLL